MPLLIATMLFVVAMLLSGITYSTNSIINIQSSNVVFRSNYLQQQCCLQQKLFTAAMPCHNACGSVTNSSKAHCDNNLATILCHNACGKFSIHQHYLRQSNAL